MPLTPLHFGLLAPINHVFPGRLSTVSFTLVTLWIDERLITAALTGHPLPDHGGSHTFIGAMILGVVVAMVGVRSSKWVLGAFFGAITHLLLDAIVHADIEPLAYFPGNPFYLGHMQLVSLVLLPLMLWFIVQSVSYSLDWIRRHWAAYNAWRYRL